MSGVDIPLIGPPSNRPTRFARKTFLMHKRIASKLPCINHDGQYIRGDRRRHDGCSSSSHSKNLRAMHNDDGQYEVTDAYMMVVVVFTFDKFANHVDTLQRRRDVSFSVASQAKSRCSI